MQLENSFTVPVPAADAWRLLLDLERVAPCMPGATLEGIEGDTFMGNVKVKVGPIQMTYRGQATFAERDDANHMAIIKASGKETRGSGTAAAVIHASLHEDAGVTEVKVVTDVDITGKPAQFGRGVIADVAGRLTAKFADNLAALIAESGAHEQPAPAGVSPAPAGPAAPSVAPDHIGEGAEGGPAATEAGPAQAPVPAAGAGGPVKRAPEAEALNLLGVAGAPILKRLIPAVLILAVVIVAIILIINA